MRLLKMVRLRMRSLLTPRRVETELDDELRDHLERQIALHQANGLSPAAARDAALREFGNVALIQEQCRDTRQVQRFDSVLGDVTYALRSLRRAPAHSLVAILSLALAIGANTAIFSLVNALLLRDLPVANPHELVELGRLTSAERGDFSYPAYEHIRDANVVFGAVLAMSTTTMQASVEPPARPPIGRFVSGSFFEGLGLTAVVGRVLTPADDRANAVDGPALAVITYALWQRAFGGDPAVIGRTLRVEPALFTIVGVLPPAFEGLVAGRPDDFFVPLASEPRLRPESWLSRAGFNWLAIVGRLRPGTSLDTARANLDAVFTGFIDNTNARAPQENRLQHDRVAVDTARAGLSVTRADLSRPVLLLMGAVGIVLLIACSNIVNLLLARGSARGREIGMRVAIGATRGRLMQQLLIEAATLGAIGGVLGFAIAIAGTRVVAILVANGDPALAFDLRPDRTVLAFTVAISLGAALVSGLVPALRLSRRHAGPRTWDMPALAGAANVTRWNRVFIAAQVALSVLLLAAASLLVTSLRNLRAVDTGLDRDRVSLMTVSPGRAGYSGDRRLDYYRDVLERARQVPGVRAASLSLMTPVSGSWTDMRFGLTEQPQPDEAGVYVNSVSDGYFATMGMPLLRGRDFTAQDGPNAPPVIVVNDALVRRYFQDENPIGRRVRLGARQLYEIVGVASNAKYLSLREEAKPTAFLHALQRRELATLTLAANTTGEPTAVASTVRHDVQALSAGVPIAQPSLLSAQLERSLSRERLVTRILGAFAGIALLLVVVGLYGVLAYAVTRRTHEIGVRLALGAARTTVLASILWEASRLVAAGLVVGMPAALATTQLLTAYLYGVSATDPWILGGIVAVLFAAAVVAAGAPAWRASRVDPIVALRCE